MDAFCLHSMLYQTHHHLRSLSSIPPLSSSSTPSLLPSSLQEMECVEAALKSGFRKEMALKSSRQAFLEDIWVFNGQNEVSCDDYSVDDLFDFTNEEGFLEQQHEEEEEEEEEPVSSSPKTQKLNQENHFSHDTTDFEYGSLSTNELAVPADDLAELEWLSNFVEDSFSEHSTAYLTGTLTKKPKLPADKLPEPEKPVSRTCFRTSVPGKARSKRTRTGGRVWSLVASPSLTESSSSSTSSTSSSSPWFFCPNSVSSSTSELSEPCSMEKPPVKKQKKRPATDSASWSGTQPARKCSHCGVTRTPQWRAGPMGAKTLCNACGVRFKSGRLFPEYRPACSPTFSSDLHSNHHRKVLEMRRNKETLGWAAPGLAPRVVPSYG